MPSVLNNWPMKPSGVQLASPIRPPDLQTRSSSGALRLNPNFSLAQGYYGLAPASNKHDVRRMGYFTSSTNSPTMHTQPRTKISVRI